MSDALKSVLENIEHLSTKEKALAAHCLLTAMSGKANENVDSEWLALAESRSADLENAKVKGLTWADIKQDITG